MKLEATVRATDTASASALRQQGRLPAIVYNRGLNVSVSVDERSFDRVFRSQGTSNLIDLEVDGEVHEVLVKAVQMNKRARVAVHVDFYAVTAGQKVSLHVPIELVGTPVGVKDGGQLDVQRREVHISILPRLIPHSLQLDVTALTIGDSLHVSDLRSLLPDEAEILDDLELAVVAVVPPRLAVEDEERRGRRASSPR
jgi:large subunit ribosomal protein L25